MTLYLEQYFDGLQKLPQELTGNLRKLREMDESVTTSLQQADQLVRVYMKSTKSSQLTVKAKNEKFVLMKRFFNKFFCADMNRSKHYWPMRGSSPTTRSTWRRPRMNWSTSTFADWTPT